MKIFSNLAISIDGKIAEASLPTKSLGTSYDRRRMDELRHLADVVLVGAGTVKAHPHTNRVKKVKKNKSQPANAIVTASGKLDPMWDFWDDPEVVRIVFTTDAGLQNAKHAARERAFVISVGAKEIDLKKVVTRLKESGLENVLVEGGGETVAAFLGQGLLHEMHVTLTPWALGGRGNPSIVSGDKTLLPWRKLKLLRVRKVKDELYLHYKVLGSLKV